MYAATDGDCRSWVLVLEHLIKKRRQVKNRIYSPILTTVAGNCREQRAYFDENEWLSENFTRADVNHDGTLTFAELWQLLKKLEIELSERHCQRMFQANI